MHRQLLLRHVPCKQHVQLHEQLYALLTQKTKSTDLSVLFLFDKRNNGLLVCGKDLVYNLIIIQHGGSLNGNERRYF